MSSAPQEEDVRRQISAAVTARSAELPDLLDRHYQSLRRIAQRICSREQRNHSLNPTALVHEVYLKLLDQPLAAAGDTLFFRACFARQCRRVLVEHARQRQALRRGGGNAHVTLTGSEALDLANPVGILQVHEALERLAAKDARSAHVADLRLFANMTIQECAESLDVSARTVDTDWQFARSYLKRELQ